MVTGMARQAQLNDPRKVRVILDGKERWSEIYRNNPRIATQGERGDFQSLIARANSLRPYMAEKTFGQWKWKAYKPPVGEIYFSDDELRFGKRHTGRIIFEPNTKAGASPNKRWPWAYWEKLTTIVRRSGHRPTQIGVPGSLVLPWVEFIPTENIRLAAALLANADASVMTEGGLMHAAAAVKTPAVVIFGAFISPSVTGYADQISLFRGHGLGCGMRVHCNCCKKAMDAITPEEAAEKLMTLLTKQKATA